MRVSRFLHASILLFSLCSCENSNDPISFPSGQGVIFIVNEGNFGTSNSTLSIYDPLADTTYQRVFRSVNGRKLGDFASYMWRDDNFGYVSVTNSDRLFKISLSDYTVLQETWVKSPRGVAAFSNTLLVGSYADSSIIVLNSSDLSVVTTVKLSHRPGELVIHNTKAYVANTMGSGASSGSDSLISVLDLAGAYQVNEVFIGARPISLTANSLLNRVYVASQGSGYIVELDPTTDQVLATFGSGNPTRICTSDSLLASISGDNKSVVVYGLPFGQQIATVSGNFISVALDGKVLYTADGNDFISGGVLRTYSTNYQIRKSYKVGVAPANIIIDRN